MLEDIFNSHEWQQCFNVTVLYYSSEWAEANKVEIEIGKAHIYHIKYRKIIYTK